MNKPNFLVVEDDNAIKKLISITLETQDYKFRVVETGKECLIEAVSNKPDIIILDLGLPDMDGVEVIGKLRTWSSIPIIVISARSSDEDKIAALDAGADDYLTKPFSVNELLARLRVLLRRVRHDDNKDGKSSEQYINGTLKIDYMSAYAYINNEEIHLTPIEYKLLCLLAKNTGKVLTHNFIINEIWGSSFIDDTKSLRVFMASLRKKIEIKTNEKYIQTRIGIGYMITRIENDSDEKKQ